ncbi:hypothetical protein [Chryseobacterium turcicum]|uniref:Uncharacterized protein n=1 Tax=Chryseobacterium turcicum TaxID=2898076 RepID=A0A9Q3YUW2_9FLAO|nr:hypothetical protein [Chryseobacterium turcicum]MCD1116816.1 hypothetical protein [Chryseobacterium turcicum]
MKKITTIILLLFAIFLFGQNSITNVDSYIKHNFKKSTSYKKQVIKNIKNCNIKEIYFVEGFDSKKKLVERYIVFFKNNKFTKSNSFIYWAAQKHPVLYSHTEENSEESLEDIKTLKINMYIRFSSYCRNVSNNEPFEELVSKISSV